MRRLVNYLCSILKLENTSRRYHILCAQNESGEWDTWKIWFLTPITTEARIFCYSLLILTIEGPGKPFCGILQLEITSEWYQIRFPKMAKKIQRADILRAIWIVDILNITWSASGLIWYQYRQESVTDCTFHQYTCGGAIPKLFHVKKRERMEEKEISFLYNIEHQNHR